MKIAIAVASGFIGKNLINILKDNYNIVGISRSNKKDTQSIEWIKTDLFSLCSTHNAIQGCDIAIFLVHSMLPSSKLFQGRFQDTDLMLADNFARACIKNKVKQIIYLGGLIPSSGTSKHLISREEVEKVFKSTNIPFTIFRAGMVVGNGGSSFEILKNLVINLPLMILPKWTKSKTQTIFIDDLLSVLNDSIGNKEYYNKIINVVNGENISYEVLIKQTIFSFGKKTLTLSIPINYLYLSKLWIKIFGETDYELVSPLIDSLLCDLDHPQIPKQIEHLIRFRSYRDMLLLISKKKIINKTQHKNIEANTVRSIQRLANKNSYKAEDISDFYINWLPVYFHNILKVEKINEHLIFTLIHKKIILLELSKNNFESDINRVKFNILGGLLSQSKNNGWLEFRVVSDESFSLVSINEYKPALPWFFYCYTQAPFHAKVMRDFGKFINQLGL